jgi:N-formylglutamate deformylase
MSHPAYRYYAPIDPPAPVVYDSPHSGIDYPADFAYAVDFATLRQAEDTDVDDLYAAAPAAGATLICATFPRSYIDANRALVDMDPLLLESPWPGPMADSDKVKQGIGLVWRLLDSGDAIYQRHLTAAEVMRRITQFHQPYQRAVKDALDAAHTQFGAVWHINCHSMNAVGGANSADAGQPRADFVLGDRDGTTAGREFTWLVQAFLRGAGYDVKVNDPYKGVELVRAFSDPGEHRHSLQIEVNRRLYMDEKTRERSRNYATVKADITRLVATISDYARMEADALALHCAHHDHHHHHHGHHHHDHHHDHDHDHDHDHGHGHHHDHDAGHHDHGHAHAVKKGHAHVHADGTVCHHDHDHDHDHDHGHAHGQTVTLHRDKPHGPKAP